MLILVTSIPGDREVEREAYWRLRDHQIRGEWSDPTDAAVEIIGEIFGQASTRWIRNLKGERPH
jgi:hypothetical protein